MKVEIEVPDYFPQRSIRMQWDPGFEILAQLQNGVIRIAANEAGLISLARHLLTLSQAEVPPGAHIHLDEDMPLEKGSSELILEKI